MNTPAEIMDAYRAGRITEAECWAALAAYRPERVHAALTEPPSKIYEPLNETELVAIGALQRVSFGMNRSGKRFAHQVKEAKELTARQREFLRLLIFKYRRQIWRRDEDAAAKGFCEQMRVRPAAAENQQLVDK